MNIQELANQTYKYFEKKTRTNGDIFWATKEGSPEWIKDMIHAAHGDMMPDDWKYKFVVEALSEIMDSEDPEDVYIEADIYTHDLLSWLSSHLERTVYVDEAVKELGHSDSGIVGDIMEGQQAEKQEVYWSVLNSLKEQLEQIEEEEETEEE